MGGLLKNALGGMMVGAGQGIGESIANQATMERDKQKLEGAFKRDVFMRTLGHRNDMNVVRERGRLQEVQADKEHTRKKGLLTGTIQDDQGNFYGVTKGGENVPLKVKGATPRSKTVDPEIREAKTTFDMLVKRFSSESEFGVKSTDWGKVDGGMRNAGYGAFMDRMNGKKGGPVEVSGQPNNLPEGAFEGKGNKAGRWFVTKDGKTFELKPKASGSTGPLASGKGADEQVDEALVQKHGKDDPQGATEAKAHIPPYEEPKGPPSAFQVRLMQNRASKGDETAKQTLSVWAKEFGIGDAPATQTEQPTPAAVQIIKLRAQQGDPDAQETLSLWKRQGIVE